MQIYVYVKICLVHGWNTFYNLDSSNSTNIVNNLKIV